MPTWYPGCKVRLKIRLEDNTVSAPPPDNTTPSGAGSEAFGSGSIDDIFPGASEFISIGVDLVPEDCTVELNSYRTADTAKMTIDIQRLPVDPATIRAIAVSVFGGVFSPSEWAAANGGIGPQGLLLPDAPTNETGVPDAQGNYTWELFRGFADDIDLSLGEDETITINCRDLTGPLLDAEVPANALQGIPGYLTLDQAIQLILTGDGVIDEELSGRFGLPGFKGLRVVNEVIDPTDPTGTVVITLPTFDELRPKAWVDSGGTVRKGRRKAPRNAQKISFWDFITDVVNGAGYIVFMRVPRVPVSIGNQTVLPASEIVITNPRTYYRDAVGAGDVHVPLQTARTFIRGYNAEDITIKRNLQGTNVPTIRVQSFDTALGVAFSGDYPALPKTNKATPTGKGDRQEVKVFNLDQVSGTNSDEIQANLEAAARSIYEQLGRGDFEVTVSTMSLSALADTLEEGIIGDLFAVRPKDPIIVEIPAQNRATGQVNEAAFLNSASVAERVTAGLRAGLDERAAYAFAVASAAPDIQTEFRTQQITWSFGREDGWTAKIDAINYLDVRDSIQTTDASLVPD